MNEEQFWKNLLGQIFFWVVSSGLLQWFHLKKINPEASKTIFKTGWSNLFSKILRNRELKNKITCFEKFSVSEIGVQNKFYLFSYRFSKNFHFLMSENVQCNVQVHLWFFYSFDLYFNCFNTEITWKLFVTVDCRIVNITNTIYSHIGYICKY